ncbi:MAG: 3-deoxy-7-phosphoheptulonate synthase [Alteromonadaceae bacterium]|nr:3-deoxy-7-phosphoheptulonate synthase [Alteromonadaceae bacterium]|tara:strand:- start:1323 stop:2459 length:1137 start_codon:yes stop_codon:yes gene_type:complete
MNMHANEINSTAQSTTAPSLSVETGLTRKTLPTPAELRGRYPLSHELTDRIAHQRREVSRILNGEDSRLLVVVGPCSLHDDAAALDYGRRLAEVARAHADTMLIVMRAYVEKPRTTVGWKGMVYDPDHTGSGDLAEGLRRSRHLLLRLAELGLPLATEALNPLVMRYLEDLISWTAIGARTAESQPHRELVSDLAMPVGIKNATDGSVDAAVNGMQAASQPHESIGIDDNGQVAALSTAGNPDTHLVLRGGRGITNYDAESVRAAQHRLREKGVNTRVMIDCSHDNARKQHQMQSVIAGEILEQRQAGNAGIVGLMLESFITEGRQDMSDEAAYGVSITDPCLGWDETVRLLQLLHNGLGSIPSRGKDMAMVADLVAS